MDGEVIEDIYEPSLKAELLNNCKILEERREDDLKYNFTRKYPLELRRWKIFNLLNLDIIKKISMVMLSDNNAAIIVTRDKMVYALGNNNEIRKLGLAECNTLKLIEIESLCGRSINKFVYSLGLCQAALLQSGEVYFWGDHKDVSYDTLRTFYSKDELDGKYVVDIACGIGYFLFLTIGGKIYFWGRESWEIYIDVEEMVDLYNVSNSLKYTTTKKSFYRVNDTLNEKRVILIACGANFNIVVTEEDLVYSWGSNLYGQLGIDKINTLNLKQNNYESTPHEVIMLSNKKIVKVVCGKTHALALTEEGQLYTWGCTCYKWDTTKKCGTSYPVKLKMKVKILDIAAQYLHYTNVALGNDGHIYIWGSWNGEKINTPIITHFTNMYDVFINDALYMIYNFMPMDIYECKCKTSNILKCLENSFDYSEMSDLIIQIEEKPIYVHKIILMIRSTYFNYMFQHKWKERNLSVIKHKQFSYTTYKVYLKYLYTDVIDASMETAFELLDLANAYCETKLEKYCYEFIKQELTISNVVFVFDAAIQRNLKDLEECSFMFILKHTTDAVTNIHFINLNREIRVHLICKLVEAGALKT